MNRSLACIKNKFITPETIKNSMKGISLTVPIYLLMYVLMIVFRSKYPEHFLDWSLGYAAWFWGAITIQLVVYLGVFFRNDFNFLIIMSNTRIDIFKSQVVFAIALSALYAVLAAIDLELVMFINRFFEFKEWTIMTFLYATMTPNFILQVFLFFTFYLFCSTITLFLTALAYQYGRTFHTFFWALVTAFTGVILPLLLWFFGLYPLFYQWLSWMLGFGKESGMLIGAGNLMILAVIFVIAIYFSIRRLPLKM